MNKSKILQILTISYPVLTHIAISQNQFELAFLLLGIIAGLSVITRTRQPGKSFFMFYDFVLLIGLIILGACIVFVDVTRVTLYLPPLLIISFITFIFTKSLMPGQEPLITRIARVIFQDDNPEMTVYTRQVTWLWACFLIIIFVETIALTFFASMETWSLFTNVLNYVFMGILFILEYIYRQMRFGYRHSIFYYLRGLAQFPLKQIFKS